MEPVTTDINMASLLLATAAILVTILGSTITTVVLIFRQFNHLDTKIGRLDTKFDNKIDGLDKKFETRIDGLDKKFTGEFRTVHGELRIMRREISNVGERLARVEGHLMGHESFSPSPLPPPPDELDDSARQAI